MRCDGTVPPRPDTASPPGWSGHPPTDEPARPRTPGAKPDRRRSLAHPAARPAAAAPARKLAITSASCRRSTSRPAGPRTSPYRTCADSGCRGPQSPVVESGAGRRNSGCFPSPSGRDTSDIRSATAFRAPGAQRCWHRQTSLPSPRRESETSKSCPLHPAQSGRRFRARGPQSRSRGPLRACHIAWSGREPRWPTAPRRSAGRRARSPGLGSR